MEILNFREFIAQKGAKEVYNSVSITKDGVPTKGGLYDPEIFGFLRENLYDKYGYINLNMKVLHPLIHKNMGKISNSLNRILTK
jgi:DNA-directed RNA polymerase beta' subunit